MVDHVYAVIRQGEAPYWGPAESVSALEVLDRLRAAATPAPMPTP